MNNASRDPTERTKPRVTGVLIVGFDHMYHSLDQRSASRTCLPSFVRVGPKGLNYVT